MKTKKITRILAVCFSDCEKYCDINCPFLMIGTMPSYILYSCNLYETSLDKKAKCDDSLPFRTEECVKEKEVK